ncbi:MAG: TIR domain-containing protein [Thermoanaerobaculia bacterium]
MGYRFFLSYKRITSQRHEVEQFFTKLSDSLGEILPQDGSEPGFYDGDIEPASDWGDRISGALSESRAIVCLLSEQYLESSYCRKELSAFLTRLRQQGKRPADLVIPITWTPISRPLHPLLAALQDGYRSYPDEYREKGLARLGRQNRYADSYTEIVETLASVIRNNTNRIMLADSPVPSFAETIDEIRPDALDEELGPVGPKNPRFIFIAAHPTELPELKVERQGYSQDGSYWWCPYQPPDTQPIGPAVNEMVLQENLRFFEIHATSGPMLMRKISLAAAKNTPVAILVDPWSLTVDRYRDLVRTIKELAIEEPQVENRCGVFVSWNERDPDTQVNKVPLLGWVTSALQVDGRKPLKYCFERIEDLADFRQKLFDTFRTMNLKALDVTGPLPDVPLGEPAPTLSAVPENR